MTMTIGQLAKQLGVNPATIRYYEKRNLIPTSIRSKGGHRLYPKTVVSQLHFIQNAKLSGFSLEEIEELITIQMNKKGTSKQVKNLVIAKLKVINNKIESLQNIQKILESFVAVCDGKIPLTDCPILKSLKGSP